MKKILVILFLLTLFTVGCTKNNNINQLAEFDKPQENDTTTENKTPNTENPQKEDEKIIISPNFELESMDGTMVKLSDLRDKNIILIL